jgi:transcriptional regulator with XRE-family HTH domain
VADEAESLAKRAIAIGSRVRALRERRRWTQAELARRLGLSQPRLSQVERGGGSFTAEQFLRILELFNVGVEHFTTAHGRGADEVIQNALARRGAPHLVETEAPVPTELDDPTELVCAVLRRPTSPRHVAALAPVVVANIDTISLREVALRLARLGRERRLGWLVECIGKALDQDRPTPPRDRLQAQRARLVLELFSVTGGVRPPPPRDLPDDLLDVEARSLRSAERIFAEAGAEARKWSIATRLRTEDFLAALESARESR